MSLGVTEVAISISAVVMEHWHNDLMHSFQEHQTLVGFEHWLAHLMPYDSHEALK
jgi:hypothetical protein